MEHPLKFCHILPSVTQVAKQSMQLDELARAAQIIEG